MTDVRGETRRLEAERDELLEWKRGTEQMHWPEEAHRLQAENVALRSENRVLRDQRDTVTRALENAVKAHQVGKCGQCTDCGK